LTLPIFLSFILLFFFLLLFFIKTWEKLILSKLDWDVNLVIPQDYLEPVCRQLDLPASPETPANWAESHVKNELLKNASLASLIVQRTPHDFCRRNSPRLVASASIILAIKACQSSRTKSGEESPAHENDLLWTLPPALRQRLCLSSLEDASKLKDCLNEMETVLLNYLQKSPSDGATCSGNVTPPRTKSATNSPFKVCNSSTPKSCRFPLRENSNVPIPAFRIRLSHSQSQANEDENQTQVSQFSFFKQLFLLR